MVCEFFRLVHLPDVFKTKTFSMRCKRNIFTFWNREPTDCIVLIESDGIAIGIRRTGAVRMDGNIPFSPAFDDPTVTDLDDPDARDRSGVPCRTDTKKCLSARSAGRQSYSRLGTCLVDDQGFDHCMQAGEQSSKC